MRRISSIEFGCLTALLAATPGLGEASGKGVIVLPGAQNVAFGDVTTGLSSAAIPRIGRTSLKAFSIQTGPPKKGPNEDAFVFPGSVGPANPVRLKGASTGIPIPNGAGFTFTAPPVALLNQRKSLITNGTYQEVDSESGQWLGYAGQQQGVTAPGRTVYAAGLDLAAGGGPPGQAAGSAYDPFSLGAGTYNYAPTLDTAIEVGKPGLDAGVQFFAVDSNSFTSDSVNRFELDGSPESGTLWSLTISEDEHDTDPSKIDVDFELNANDTEINLPMSYLMSLPGYSSGLTTAEIDALVDENID